MRYGLQSYMAAAFRFDRYAGKRVLDVGCGSGIDAAEFARNGALVSACDFTKPAIEATYETFLEAKLRAHSIVRCPATSLAWESNYFDLVYCFGVLHHLDGMDLKKAIDEAYRVLKPGGLYAVMVYNRDSLLYSYSIEHLGLEFERIPGAPETRAYTRDELGSLLLLNGFEKVKIVTRFPVIDTPEARKVKLHIRNSLGLGWHLIGFARKPK